MIGFPGRAAAAFLLLFSAIPASAAPESLGVFDAWGAFRDGEGPRCYAIAEPARRSAVRRWRPFAAVGTWPRRGVRDQAHFRLSRDRADNAAVTLSIGPRRFVLTGAGADAWAADRAMDAAIVAAMRSGTSMSVESVSRQGRPFADVYALRGAATAIDSAALGCARLKRGGQ